MTRLKWLQRRAAESHLDCVKIKKSGNPAREPMPQPLRYLVIANQTSLVILPQTTWVIHGNLQFTSQFYIINS